MDELMIFTVFEVSAHLRQVIETQIDELYVRGEVSNFTHHSSGHMYFNLKDDNATLRCTFFRRANLNLDFQIKDGLEVVCFGKLTVYEKGGSYNLNVQSVSLSGKGDLSQRFELLKKKLNAEGLFDPNHKKALPRYPQKIGIVTSPTGAALQDIGNILRRRYPVEVEVYPAVVQGSEAPAQLIAGIRYFDRRQDIDLIIITRGGGSQEDLWCFNDEALARAVFSCRHPIISAVGHEIDFSISDFVADLRAPTPSAAAELAVPDRHDLLNYLSSLSGRMKAMARSGIDRARINFAETNHSFSRFHPQARLQAMQQRFDLAVMEYEHRGDFLVQRRHALAMATRDMLAVSRGIMYRIGESRKSIDRNEVSRLIMLGLNFIDKAKTTLSSKQDNFQLRSPRELLNKGFAFISSKGAHISSVDQVDLREELTIHLSDGSLQSTVTGKHKDPQD